MKYLFEYLEPLQAVYGGKINNAVDFVTDKQLLDEKLWQKFAKQFEIRLDSFDKGWRGEYWGKMMRGACLTYMYLGSEELYKTLVYAVNELLKYQDELGRISTYSKETEFNGWDTWCRKYVLTGLQHFYKICKDSMLKERVLSAMINSANYVCEKVGENKIDICKTSGNWFGVNSASILEPFVELYKITSNKKYLDFAKYVISTGGCSNGNLITCAENTSLYPYQYPVKKAYEVMSFFEGVLSYYEVTGEKRYFSLVKNFVERVYETERTAVGGVGGEGELFTNFYSRQTEEIDTVVQETCVTVTWIRLLARLYFNTGDVNYIDRIEKSALNAMLGSLNTEWNTHYSSIVKQRVSPLPFDSYSPLVNNKRGSEVGGFRSFQDGTFYGCCACIGSAGVALIPLLAVLREDDGFVFNMYFSGEISAKTKTGNSVKITIDGNYPVDSRVKIRVKTQKKERFLIRFRKPSWCSLPSVSGVDCVLENGYFNVDKIWDNDQITLEFPAEIKTETLNGKTAFSYGAITLARDDFKEKVISDLDVVDYSLDISEIATEKLPPNKGEMARFKVSDKSGKKSIILTDYASCGKKWDENNKISVWLKENR